MPADIRPSRISRFVRFWWLWSALIAVAVCYWAHLQNERKWEMKWQDYVAGARDRDVKLYLSEFLPTESIPDAENFAATPLWKEVFALNGQGPRATKLGLLKKANPFPHPRKGVSRPAETDFAEWRRALARIKESAKPDPSVSDPEAILKGLEFIEPELAEIREALHRPKVFFPVRWDDGLDLALPHIPVIQHIGQSLSLKASAMVELRDSAGALRDFQAVCDVATKLDQEPLMVIGSVEVNLVERALNTLEKGLNRNLWTPEQLQEIESRLANLNMFRRFMVAITTEQCFTNTALEPLVRAASGRNLRIYTEKTSWVQNLYSSRASFWRENQLWINRAIEEQAIPWDTTRELWTPLGRGFIVDEIPNFQHSWDMSVAAYTLPVFDTAAHTFLFVHDRVRMAGLACALERYRIAKGAYPATLDALVPDFLPKLPHDPCDGQSFRYRLIPEGYLLYSIGIDRVDDDGKVKSLGDEISGPDWRWWSPERLKQ